MMDSLTQILPNFKMNKKTQKFVDNFIKDHGGMDKFKNEMSKRPAPQAPGSAQQSSYTLKFKGSYIVF